MKNLYSILVVGFLALSGCVQATASLDEVCITKSITLEMFGQSNEEFINPNGCLNGDGGQAVCEGICSQSSDNGCTLACLQNALDQLNQNSSFCMTPDALLKGVSSYVGTVGYPVHQETTETDLFKDVDKITSNSMVTGYKIKVSKINIDATGTTNLSVVTNLKVAIYKLTEVGTKELVLQVTPTGSTETEITLDVSSLNQDIIEQLKQGTFLISVDGMVQTIPTTLNLGIDLTICAGGSVSVEKSLI